MSDEDLNANPLFTAFLDSNWFKVAAQQQLIIAVPSKTSLSSLKINNDHIENHVLKQSPYYQDEYITVNGKSVSYNSSQLICKQSNQWTQDRTVTIQAQELYYDDQFESFSILRVTLPLDGKISDDYLRSLEASNGADSSRPERRSISQHEQLLVRLTGDSIKDNNSIFGSIHKFIVQFNTSYVLVKGFIEHAGQKVADACSRLSDEASSKVRTLHRDLFTSRPSLRCEVHWAIESIVMQHIHKKVFTGLCELYRSEEEHLQSLIFPLRDASQQSLGVRDDIVCHPNVAIALLADLGSFQTPLRKLAQLENVSRALTQAVRQSTQQTSVKDNVLSAEDIIPLTLYSLIHSGLPHVFAHLQYLIHFAPNRSIGSLDHIFVHFANFHAAVELIQSGALMMSINQSSVNGASHRAQPELAAAERTHRTRANKVNLHQRSVSTLPVAQSINTANGHSNVKSSIVRLPSRSPTRSFSVIHDDERRWRRPSVARIVSTPLSVDHANGDTLPRLSSHSKPTDEPLARTNRRTQPLPLRQQSDNTTRTDGADDGHELGEFLSNLKKHSNIVVGSFNDQGPRW